MRQAAHNHGGVNNRWNRRPDEPPWTFDKLPGLDALLNDLRYALRRLWKAPLFSGVAILTLAIGIGATTAIFSTVNATLLRPLPFPNADQLVDVHTRLIDGRVTTGLLSSVEIGALNDSRSVVAGVAGLTNQPFEATFMRGDGTPVDVLLSGVTDGFFEVLGLTPSVGRSFTHADHLPGGRDAPFAVIVSDRAWSHLFDRDPRIVGTTIRIAELQATVTIAGVAPAALDLPQGTRARFRSDQKFSRPLVWICPSTYFSARSITPWT